MCESGPEVPRIKNTKNRLIFDLGLSGKGCDICSEKTYVPLNVSLTGTFTPSVCPGPLLTADFSLVLRVVLVDIMMAV